ncbi:MAG TPA: bifunctional diguanylate cyclase/phosphodiesterase [Pseudonocardiaceae bacterium]|jgi:diguanylate cyclase (GGDEF)-like protein|nr:bifunctional diguanylate cyclase/phosphodiesterase [Pseudonocardiaceae bacterium]
MTQTPKALTAAELLDQRISAFARSWARVLASTSFVPGGRAKARAVLEDALRRLVDVLGAQAFDPQVGRDIGRDLVANHISTPRTLGDSISLLGGRLLDELDIRSAATQPRLAALLGQLATGFTEALRDGALTAAEDINKAERAAWRDQQRRMYRRLQHALLHDQLTDLPNRAQFTGWLEEIIARAAVDDRVGLCVINLDRFKTITDSIGMDKADQLLLAVANRLRPLANRYGHFLAHLGGDTFAIGVERTLSSDDVAKVADRALRTLSDPIRLDGMQIPVTASAGIVERTVVGAQAVELIRAADISVGWAKVDQGAHRRGRWAVFDSLRNAEDVRKHTLTAAMPAALARNEFGLAYQPLTRLGDGELIGVEALARWHHPSLGLIGPGQFIPAAEDTGLIVPLGIALLEQACRQAVRWRDGCGVTVLMSANLAVAQIREPGLVPAIASVLRRTGWDPTDLQLEIVESAFIGTDDEAMETLDGLTRLGIRLAIDDFGTGYSSLAYLAELPVHNVKLAARFLRGLDGGSANRTILPALVALSHDLELSVTAEGIENREQAEYLREIGCDLGQGYFLGRPVRAEMITELMTRRGSSGSGSEPGMRPEVGMRPAAPDATGRKIS